MKTAILTLDFGMSNIHSTLIDLKDGSLITDTEETYQWDNMADARCEINLETLWGKSQSVLQALLDKYDRAAVDIAAMGFSFFGDNFACFDENRKPISLLLGPGDWRAEEDMEELRAQFHTTTEEFAEITGAPLDRDLAVSRMYWVKKHAPELYRKTKYFYSLQQYILMQIGLEPLNDFSMAARKVVLDLHTNDWSTKILDVLGTTREAMGEVVAATTIVGRIDRYGAVKLPHEMPVMIGGHDAMQGFIGLGSAPLGTPGMMFSLAGSYNLFGLQWGEFLNTTSVWKPGLYTGCGAQKGSYHYQMGDLIRPVMEWCIAQFYSKAPGAMNELSARVTYDATCTIRMTRDPRAGNGCFEGLSVNHTVVDLFTAIMEAITFHTKEMLDIYVQLMGDGFRVLRIGAGGAKADNLNQFKADLLNMTVERVANRQASSVGVAVNAAVGIGAYASHEDAMANMVRVEKSYTPNPEISARYQEKYQQYLGK